MNKKVYKLNVKGVNHNVEYFLIDDSDSADRDIKKLKCVIDEEKKVVFEFSDAVLRFSPTAESLFQKIKNFLQKELEDDNLQERYFIKPDHYLEFLI